MILTPIEQYKAMVSITDDNLAAKQYVILQGRTCDQTTT